MTFYDWSAGHAKLNQLLQLSYERLPSIIVGLNGRRADNMKQTLLDFSISLSKGQKIVAAEE